ncbi:MAG: histidine kinase [Bacteroidota bacterium]
MKRRWLYHLLFWLALWLINGYLEFYLVTFEGDLPIGRKLVLAFSVELMVMPLRMTVVYTCMYYFLPKYFEGRNYGQLVLSIIAFLALSLLAYRLMVEELIYPMVYRESIEIGEKGLLIPRLVWAAMDFIYLAGISTAIKLVRMRLKTLEREKQLIEEKLQSELSFLRAQTNPHFLFNTLNNIYALARKQSAATAPVVLKLSKMLRFMLYDCVRPRIAIGQEAQVIRDFIELEELRYNKRLQVNYTEAIDDAQQQIAPLLLLPLVENAFKHGASESRFEIQIQIQLSLKRGKLHLHVQNPKGERLTPNGKVGIGLKNVRRQLELIYPNAHELKIDDQQDRFLVNLHIDLEKDQPLFNHQSLAESVEQV